MKKLLEKNEEESFLDSTAGAATLVIGSVATLVGMVWFMTIYNPPKWAQPFTWRTFKQGFPAEQTGFLFKPKK